MWSEKSINNKGASLLGQVLAFARVGMVALLLSAAPIGAYAQTIADSDFALAWDNPSDADLAGITLRYGAQSGSYSNGITLGKVTSHNLSLADGTYFFAAFAFDFSGNVSTPSNELIVQVKSDGVPTSSDNCSRVYNPDQSDVDNDGVGDKCDSGDSDGDQVADLNDNCPGAANQNQLDSDGDGIGDACEGADDRGGDDSSLIIQDFDGDGVSDIAVAKWDRKLKQLIHTIYLFSGQVLKISMGQKRDTAAHANYLSAAKTAVGTIGRRGANLVLQARLADSDAVSEKVLGSARSKFVTGCTFNGDGLDDVALFNRNQLSISYSDGSSSTLPLGSLRKIVSASCADLDGDGSDELILSGSPAKSLRSSSAEFKRAKNVIIAINVLGETVLQRTAPASSKVIAADFDGDGDSDLAVTNRRNNGLLILGAADAQPLKLTRFKEIAILRRPALNGSLSDTLALLTAKGQVFTMNLRDRVLQQFAAQ